MIEGLLITLGIVIGIWLATMAFLIHAGRRSDAREIAMLLPNLLGLFRGLLRDGNVPRTSKAWLWFAVVWLASPIDLIPEFIPVVGPLDDALVAGLVLRYVARRTDRAVLERHWRGSGATLDMLAGRI